MAELAIKEREIIEAGRVIRLETIEWLSSVDRFALDIEREGRILPQTRLGAQRDETTHAAEDSLVEFSVPFEYDFRDGQIITEQGPLAGVSERGVRQARKLVASDSRFGFQLERTLAESNNIAATEKEMAKGDDAGIVIEASGFPAEPYKLYPDHVKKMAYRYEDEGLFFRMTRREQGKVVIKNVALPGSDTKALAGLMRELASNGHWLVDELPDDASSLDVLASPVVIPKDLFENPETEIAYAYNGLGFNDRWQHFQEVASPYVNRIVDFSAELANSRFGSVTEKVVEQIWQAHDARAGGRYMLPRWQRQVLAAEISRGFDSGISREAEGVLKKFYTYSTWALIHAQMNPDQAVNLYGEGKTTELLRKVAAGGDTAELIQLAGMMAAEAGRCAGGCGGGIDYNEDGNIFNMTSGEFKDFLANGESQLREGQHVHCPDCGMGQKLRKVKDEDGNEYFSCRNPKCSKKAPAN